MRIEAGAAFADPVEGNWKTKPDDNGNFGIVKIAACGDKRRRGIYAPRIVNADGTPGATNE